MDSSQLSLIADQTGPVAVVEISGVTLDGIYLAGGPRAGGARLVNPDGPSSPPPVVAYQAKTAFLVVNLADGDTTGGMIATPRQGSAFPLDQLGPVTSWAGPRRFGSPPPTPYTVTIVDTPHSSSP